MSVSGIECVRLPDVPAIVMLYVPGFTGLFTRIVSPEEPDPLTVVELHDAEARCGIPLTVRVTGPVKPFSDDTEMVSVPVPLRGICNVVGAAESEKSPAEVTFNVTLTE